MTRASVMQHTFVDQIPGQLDDGVLYVCLKYAVVVHVCCCGCRREVVTPLSPAQWVLTFDGESVSLWPSIGNWSFECRSHYWISKDTVRWDRLWTERRISAARDRDRAAAEEYFDSAERGRVFPGSARRK